MYKKFLLLVAVSAMPFASAGEWDKEPTAFAGIILGKTFEESGISACPAGTSLLDVFNFQGEKRCYVKSGKYSYISGFPFGFTGSGIVDHGNAGEVATIMLEFPSSKYEELLSILVERYGPATGARKGVVANQLGGSFGNHTSEWDGVNVRIIANQRFSRLDKGALVIQSKAFLEEKSKDRAANAKAAASKL